MARFTEHIILTVFEEMLLEMPFDQITVSALSRRCDISPNTFYYHYRDLNDLLAFWLRAKVDAGLAEIPESFSWTERVKYVFRRCKESELLIFHISDSNGRAQLEDYVFSTSSRHIFDCVEDLIRDMRLSESARQALSKLMRYAFLGFFIQFLQNRMTDDIDKSVDWFARQLRLCACQVSEEQLSY